MPRAASSSSAAASSSPSARQASPTSTRVRAISYGASSACQVSRALPQRDERRLRVAVREVDRALRMGDQRRQHRAVVASRELLELDARTARGLDLAHREHDLDEGREQPRPLERQRGRRLRPADRRRSRLGASLREAQLSESGLRLPTEPARLLVRRSPRRRTRPAAGGARPGDSGRGLPPDSSSPRSAPRLGAPLPTRPATSRPAGGSPPGARDSDR